MKHHLLLRVSIVLAGLARAALADPSQPAGSWGYGPSDTPQTDWQAQWIWLPEEEVANVCLARREFTISNTPDQAILSITACSRYQLWINGEYVRVGPARCAAHHQSYDVLEVANRLRVGKNVLAIRVHHHSEDVSYYDPTRGGLLAQLELTLPNESTVLTTDASWRVVADASWRDDAPKVTRFHLAVCDRVDLRRSCGPWTFAEYDDADWSAARVLRRETGWPTAQPNELPGHLIPPWTTLVARDIPYLVERTYDSWQSVSLGSMPEPHPGAWKSPDAWGEVPPVGRVPCADPTVSTSDSPHQSANGAVAVPAVQPGQIPWVLFEREDVRFGRPCLDITGSAGTIVDIMAAPYPMDGHLVSPIVDSSYVDRIVLREGRQQWQALYPKPVRLLAVVPRLSTGKLTIHAAGVMAAEYPFTVQGSFRTPGFPELERLWTASAETIRVCVSDAYTDNYREQRQYAQTAYYACMGNYATYGDTALQRRYLRQVAEEQLADGLMPAYAPRHGADFMVILDSNCFWVLGLHQYLIHSGDRDTTKTLLPAAHKLLDLLASYTNDDGLIDSPAQPYWLDHAVIDRRGANFCLNGLYLGALESFAEVLRWLEEPGEEIYRQRAARIRANLGRQAWDPARQMFADAILDGHRSDQFSEHAAAIGLAFGIANGDQADAVAAQLLKEDDHDFIHRASGLVMVTPPFSYYLHAGLCDTGHVDASLALAWSRFEHMLADGVNGTLWEEWWLDATGRTGRLAHRPSGRSDAQTESTFFPALFARYLLGVEPTKPGMSEVTIRHYRSDRVPRRGGAIPTPRGLLGVDWDVRAERTRLGLEIPSGTMVNVDLASLGSPAAAEIDLDGGPVKGALLDAKTLSVGPGRHVLTVPGR